MNFTYLGNSDDKICKIGLGSLFNNYHVRDNTAIRNLIDKAFDLKMNFIDTAPVYGSGEIEKIIGTSVANKRDKFIIGTKCLPSKNKFKEIISSANLSLKRLNMEFIDLFQIHWPNHNVAIEETCEAIETLIKEGKIKYAGICNYPLKDLKKYHQLLGNKLVSIQNEFNLLERGEGESLKRYIEDRDITMIGYSPFLNGKFCNGELQKKVLDDIASKYSKSRSEIILNWICSQSRNFITIPSTLRTENLISNANSQDFALSKLECEEMTSKCKTLTEYICTKEIYVDQVSSNIYHSLVDAKKNIHKLNPSPIDLANEIKDKNILKPIKVSVLKNNTEKKYLLEDGVLRYWSWVIAFGEDKKIPSLVFKE